MPWLSWLIGNYLARGLKVVNDSPPCPYGDDTQSLLTAQNHLLKGFSGAALFFCSFCHIAISNWISHALLIYTWFMVVTDYFYKIVVSAYCSTLFCICFGIHGYVLVWVKVTVMHEEQGEFI